MDELFCDSYRGYRIEVFANACDLIGYRVIDPDFIIIADGDNLPDDGDSLTDPGGWLLATARDVVDSNIAMMAATG